jgi:hypothetical protein
VQSIGYNAAEISDVAGRVQPGIQDFMSILGDPVSVLMTFINDIQYRLSKKYLDLRVIAAVL